MSKMIHDQPSAAVPASRDRRNFPLQGGRADPFTESQFDKS